MKDLSLTSMDHAFLQGLELLPFDMIRVSGHVGTYKIYTLEEFRQLYNDALETILAYHKAAIHYRLATEIYRKLYGNVPSQPEY